MHSLTLILCSLVILVLIGSGRLIRTMNTNRRRKEEWSRFDRLTKQYALTALEISFLREVVAKHIDNSPLGILLEEREFEQFVRMYELVADSSERSVIRNIRIKLFGKKPVFAHRVRSTNEIPVGSRVFIKYDRTDHVALWGELVGNEREGFLVAIHAAHIDNDSAYWIFDTQESDDMVVFTEKKSRYHILLKPGTSMNVTFLLTDNQSIGFRTTVQSFVPGPSKIVYLKHSLNKMDKNEAYSSSVSRLTGSE